ncbi:MAG: O-sialoglycoprotein endopeptidase [Firmicutes bacterium]|nr:O-sialoglycoprotein endopeptidase [Bacillota bacterium]
MKAWIGFDTSCYTTSLAAVDEAGRVICDHRLPLAVPPGQRGLRQSEALFRHLRGLEERLDRLREAIGRAEIAAVAASVRPRPVEGSYLPVFLAGSIIGRAVAAGAGVPFLPTSHQEGHLRAAVEGTCLPQRFLAFHLSGGTTEILSATRHGAGFTLAILGGTADLHAGQFVDRLGVMLGLPFPAGPALEELAARGRPGAVRLPVAVRGMRVSFSGPLSAAERLFAAGVAREDLAAAALACLATSVLFLLKETAAATGLDTAVLAGGVMANRQIRQKLREDLPGMRLVFARPELSTDNAVGVALLAFDFTAGGDRHG